MFVHSLTQIHRGQTLKGEFQLEKLLSRRLSLPPSLSLFLSLSLSLSFISRGSPTTGMAARTPKKKKALRNAAPLLCRVSPTSEQVT